MRLASPEPSLRVACGNEGRFRVEHPAILPITGQIGVFTLGAGCFVIAALVVAALGIETKGRVLEDVSA